MKREIIPKLVVFVQAVVSGIDAFLVSADASPFPLTNSPGFTYSFFSRKQEKKRSCGSVERLNKYDAEM